MNKIFFNAFHQVIIQSGNWKEKMPEKSFLNILSNNIKSNDYSVFYDANNYNFTITYKGEAYSVFFTPEVRAGLRSGKYSPIILELFKIALNEKKYNDAVKAKKDYETRIRKIELSGYSNLSTLDDYKFYLTYLQNKDKTASKEEKEIIELKIKGILKNITNPYNLNFHLMQDIWDVANKGEELNDEQKAELEILLKKITDDYYQIISSRSDGLVIGSSALPMEIVRRIEEVEYLVRSWIENNNVVEEEKKEVNEDYEPEEEKYDELDDVSDKLHELLKRGKS